MPKEYCGRQSRCGGIEKVKFLLGAMAKGRKSLELAEGYQLRDPFVPYSPHFDVKNDDIR